MMRYTTASAANRKVEMTTARTIKRMSFDLASRIAHALNEPPDELKQSKGENAALSSMLGQEDRDLIPVEVIMIRLLGSVVYRSLREQRLHLERLGFPKLTVEALHDARLYCAGYIAGRANAHREVNRTKQRAKNKEVDTCNTV